MFKLKNLGIVLWLFISCLFVLYSGIVRADVVYVINANVINNDSVKKAISDLELLGNSVYTGDVLTDYTYYDQVWDLRYSTPLSLDDITYMGMFLQAGGSMYVTGENQTWVARNNSVLNWVYGIGGGTLILAGDGNNNQVFTMAGENLINNNPNYLDGITYGQAQTVSSYGTGFLTTENYADAGIGSLVGWNYSSVENADNARLLVGFDIEVFDNDIGVIDNFNTYLGGGSSSSVIPEPSGILLMLIGVVGLCFTALKYPIRNVG